MSSCLPSCSKILVRDSTQTAKCVSFHMSKFLKYEYACSNSASNMIYHTLPPSVLKRNYENIAILIKSQSKC